MALFPQFPRPQAMRQPRTARVPAPRLARGTQPAGAWNSSKAMALALGLALAAPVAQAQSRNYQQALTAVDEQAASTLYGKAGAGDAEARRQLMALAQSGSAAALHRLGCLNEQDGEARVAYGLFERAAWLGSLPAQFNQAAMQYEGRGTPADPARAQRRIALAWNGGGLPEAGAWLVEDALRDHDSDRAHAIAAALATSPTPRAALALARMYFADGEHGKALVQARRAADGGLAGGAELLVVLYRNGLGTDRDNAEASAWHLIADAILGRPEHPVTDPEMARAALRARDWLAIHRTSRDSLLACEPPADAPRTTQATSVIVPPVVQAEPMQQFAVAEKAAVPAQAAAPASAAREAPAERTGDAGPAVAAGLADLPEALRQAARALARGESAGDVRLPSPSAPQAAPAVTVTVVAPPPTAAPVPTAPFSLQTGQSIQLAWQAFGVLLAVKTSWAGPDLIAQGPLELPAVSVEQLGRRIVGSAQRSGSQMKLQLYQDASGALMAARIVTPGGR